MSKSKFIHTLSEFKNIFALEQKAIALNFVKNIAFLLGHPVNLLKLWIRIQQYTTTVFHE